MSIRPRIIVSMTSYPARIQNVPLSIYALHQEQFLPPDEVHLWLAKDQFPETYSDLPAELILLEKYGLVTIHWLPNNTYVHKRHEIFKYVQSGCVFLIDDDVIYDPELIKNVMELHAKHPNAIICYNKYDEHRYKGKRILYGRPCTGTGPYINQYRWCGQSMIPANLYPHDILSDKMQQIRNATSPVSDECWMQPWIVYNSIPICYLNFGWGMDISKDTGKDTGIVSWSHSKDANGYEKRDNWLFAVLNKFPHIHKKYHQLFGYEYNRE